MSKIIKSNFGTRFNSRNVAKGSVSAVQKNGSFYIFSVRLSNADVREYSFTNFDRALKMRQIMISHIENKIILDRKKINNTA